MNSRRPAWREPMLWLAAGIPLATLVAGLATLRIANQSGAMDAAPETVQRTAQTQTADLSADVLAARMGLHGKLQITTGGVITVAAMPIAAVATSSLRLHFIHPTSAAGDLQVTLRREGKYWRGVAGIDANIGWRVHLFGPGQRWRLVAKMAPHQHEALLRPAVAAQ